MDDQTRIELEAAAFRTLREHLMEKRPDVQNIDLMNLAGFCRNCLSRWYQEATNERGIEMTKEQALADLVELLAGVGARGDHAVVGHARHDLLAGEVGADVAHVLRAQGGGEAEHDRVLALAALVQRQLAGDVALVLAGQVVRGRIDAVYAEPEGGFLIVDWKTGRAPTADPLQLAVYRLAWAELTGVPVERVRAAFYYVRSGELVEPADLPGRFELESLLSLGSAG